MQPGKNSNTESAPGQSPGSREKLRQELLEAVKAGTFGARQIKMSPESSFHTRFNKEFAYLDHNDELPKAPRPVILIMEDVPSILRPDHVTVGIINPDTLAAYKKNAETCALDNNALKPDELRVKCLPDHRSLKRKLEEQANSSDQKYQKTTSGHLKKNGTFKPPEFREKNCEKLKCHSEWLTTGYIKSQIRCFLSVKEDIGKNITDHLQDKHQLEEVFGIESLPWMVYSQQSGSAEVYFEDEFSGHLLAHNEARLSDFAFSHNISEETFKRVLNFLPMPLKAKTLNQHRLPTIQNPFQDIIKLVADPDFSHQHLRELIERIWKLIDQDVPVQRKFLYQGESQTILDLLIISVTKLWRNTDVSSSTKNNNKGAKGRTDEEDIIFQLSTELTRRGVPVIEKTGRVLLREFRSIKMCRYLKALGLSCKETELWDLMIHPPLLHNPAVMLEFHQRCQRHNAAELQEALRLTLQRPFFGYFPYKRLKNYLLALFHFCEPNEQIFNLVRDTIADTIAEGIERSLGTLCADDYIHWVKELWERRDQEPFYQQWPENIKKGQQQIVELQKSLGLTGCQSPQTASLTQPTELQFIVDAFSQPPVLPNARDNEETILRILQHYYRRPGPERVIKCLGSDTLPGVWKPDHNCCHVLRARNNLLWYIELLEKFHQMHFSEIEKNLLSLAIIYHDAAAEDVPKRDEEARAAGYFKRDLKGQYPQQYLEEIGEALSRKEDDVHGKSDQGLLSSIRRYLHVLRFADRMDFIRCTGIDASFPGSFKDRQQPGHFDASLLDLPSQVTRDFTNDPALKPDFQRQLEAAMHGAADLLQVTGNKREDCRPDSYVQTYQLEPDEATITEKFELTPLPLKNMEKYLDDNVRRYIASRAGIHTCKSSDHKGCKTNRRKGVTRGIHNSFHDLRQVRVPTGMTRLEKMQCRQGFSLLSVETQGAIVQEVQRLQLKGILMSLGTLTQETLKSRRAKRVLAQRGFAVVSRKRFRGYNNKGGIKMQKMLVPLRIRPNHETAV
ncbi:hypothetical protein [Endozoicomonas acroporae]|uniref:hypothetical protein n=1 Tax=Endozoicomonas acroporae TaxID=1701104 RepID=UPI003D79D3DC